jgi:hypothetical protein
VSACGCLRPTLQEPFERLALRLVNHKAAIPRFRLDTLLDPLFDDGAQNVWIERVDLPALTPVVFYEPLIARVLVLVGRRRPGMAARTGELSEAVGFIAGGDVVADAQRGA